MLTDSTRRRIPARALGAGGASLLFLILLGAPACRQDRLTAPGAPVVLISVDTLRADHLPAYGYANVQTPNLDALRKDSVLFENAYSHVPLTLPSHVSIFTGLLPLALHQLSHVAAELAQGLCGGRAVVQVRRRIAL